MAQSPSENEGSQLWKGKNGNNNNSQSGSIKPESTGDDAARPKGRIRRSMTACNTCRKLKTRCDLEPRSHACRRCLSLRIDCELPETPERYQENALVWSEAAAVIPASIEERLSSLERSMGELTNMMRQMIERFPNPSNSPASRSTGWSQTTELDDSRSEEGVHLSLYVPKPVHLIRELQSEFFGRKEDFASEAHLLGDIVSKGLIDSKLAKRLIQLFVEHFGPWISVHDVSDLPQNLRQNEPFLFSTACLLASRYVPGIPLPVIHAMYLQVRRLSASVLWSAPPLKYESLQALTLLCLWTATVQTEVPMDSWLLSGISINHAIIAFEFLDRIPAEPVVTDDMLKKLRLWNALCLTQLHFAIGNARPFSLQQKYLDHCSRILEHPGARFDDGKMVAEIQLYTVTLTLQNNNQRMQRGEIEYDEIERWKADWVHLFTDESHSTLDLGLRFCQLLLYRTSLKLRPDRERLLPEIMKSSRTILSRFLQIQPYIAVDFIDHIFFVVVYAALTLCEFNIMDPLIDQIQAFLIHLSPNEEHIAYRFACIINELKRRSTQIVPQPSSVTKTEDFADSRRVTTGNTEFMSSLMDTLPEGYGSLEQLLAGFVPSQSVPGPVYGNIPMTTGMANTVLQSYPCNN
ncbi:transcriptional regulator family: Fungal Specific TF [Paecilomyces variotii]|nr:transcriptional regulator family: Fungal Specific TF [Paecilomyces variotii]KAJ9287491.1 transcriptional regulator family: Fungal Specific TF [Paecilomyces variotii]KAJ9307730.1 transcriptional regulator family: Fungal Specific TF [Paecilomyces variotii]KAJ9322976.1 transcriptional regulator family: Fungal Specific TF [Paecilomyces variotii]KAJ9330618.1 transcriptional regulator family: Fungal Specific TF [Paecilomyces variotii]